MQLKRFTDLSLRMLMHLAHTAKPGEPVPVPVLAETLQWNPNLVIKAAHFMVKSGWLTAIRGRNGGLILARAAGERSVRIQILLPTPTRSAML